MASTIVTRKGPLRYWILTYAVLAFGLVAERSAAGHREHEDRDIWFVHVTDPHLFIPAARDKEDEMDDEANQQEPKEKTCLEREQQKRKRDALAATTQEALNKKAFTEMLERIRSLPEADGRPAFLVLTGDLGIDPCDIPKVRDQSTTPTLTQCLDAYDPEERTRQISETAGVLSNSPVQDIYLVAGNNDIAKESAGDPALKYFSDFIQDVQKELIKDKSNVHLHNLTRCYVSGESLASCYADVPHSGYRLIGFPSYSFKKSEEKPQEVQFETFRQLWEDSRKQGMNALVITHTPEMDDPFALAQQRYANPAPTPTETAAPTETATSAGTPTPAGTATPAATAIPANKKTKTTKTEKKTKAQAQTDKPFPVATWNVSEKLLDDWKDLIASDSMAGVFAGHLHDSHKEIYRRPYGWSSGSPEAFRKLFLAPPLAAKRQDTSPIQARGFSLVHLQPDRIDSRVFWYDSETSAFTPDFKPKHHRAQRGFWEPLCKRFHATVRWLWELGDAQNSKSLDRMAMLLIALLATFLTVVAIWKIPPVDNLIVGEPAKSKPAVEPSPFSGNFAGLIIAGLGGLAAASVLKSFDGKPSAGDREFYIVWFVISFFVMLILSAFLRGLVEALRARFAIIHYPLPRSGTPSRGPEGKRTKNYPLWLGKLGRWLVYRFYASLHWLSSLRVPLLTFADTFINLIQGKNYTITQAFSDKIVDQQRNVLRVANAIRQQLREVIMEKLRKPSHEGGATEENQDRNKKREVCPDDVRVNISVLSLDQNSVFYISRAAHSSRQPFLKRSVAWVSVFTGKIRWYKKSYSDDKDRFNEIVLLDNSEKTIADDVAVIYLRSHYQPRSGADYEAWVVFPVPWPRQRGLEDSSYVKGAIHISFRREEHFDQLWPFGCTPDEVRKKITKEVDDEIEAAKDADRTRLQQSRDADIEAAIKTASLTCDPVIDQQHRYQNEERMLQGWCTEPEVCATLITAIKVLGEVLRGFNEHIYKSIGKSEEAD